MSYGDSAKRRWQRSREWQAIRAYILERDCWTCKSCGVSGYLAQLEVDHVDPKGDLRAEENLQVLCKFCHDKKSRTEARGRKRKRKPRPRTAWEIFRDQLA